MTPSDERLQRAGKRGVELTLPALAAYCVTRVGSGWRRCWSLDVDPLDGGGVVVRFTGVLIGLLLLVPGARAEDEYRQSHRKAAVDLLVLIGAKQQAMVGATAMADVMLQGNRMLAPYRDVLLKWAESVMTWENMEPGMVEIYAEAYTEQELRELTEFYASPLGRKTLEVTPELVRRSARVGGKLAEQHMGELQQMIRQRAAELENYQPSQ